MVTDRSTGQDDGHRAGDGAAHHPSQSEKQPARRRRLHLGILRPYRLTRRPSHYDRRRDDGDRHPAQRNLFNRLLGCLHHCLATGLHYDETTAFPAAA